MARRNGRARPARADDTERAQRERDRIAQQEHQQTREDNRKARVLSRSQARAAWVSAAIAAVAVISTAAVSVVTSRGSGQNNDVAASTNIDNSSLVVASAWPYVSGCPATGDVAMPSGMGSIDDFHATTDIRDLLTGSGAGSWNRGAMYLDLSGSGSDSIEIVNIQPHILRRDLGSPAWIYQPDDGCGPYDSNRVFTFDLDKPDWTDVGPFIGAGVAPPSDMPKAPLGPSFTVSKSQHARILIDTSSCHGNYEWNLDIQYLPSGSSTIRHDVIGPFDSYGVADNTTVYQGHQDDNGKVQVDQTSTLTGSDPTSAMQDTDEFFAC